MLSGVHGVIYCLAQQVRVVFSTCYMKLLNNSTLGLRLERRDVFEFHLISTGTVSNGARSMSVVDKPAAKTCVMAFLVEAVVGLSFS